MQYSKLKMAKAFSWQPTMDKCKRACLQHSCTRTGKFTYKKNNTKQKALFLFLVMWTVRLINCLWPSYVPFSALSIVTLLQVSDDKDSDIFFSVQHLYSYPSWQSGMHGQIQRTWMKEFVQVHIQSKRGLFPCKISSTKLQFPTLVFHSPNVYGSTIITTWDIIT